MLILLYLVQYKYIKIRFKHPPSPWAIMYRKTFVRLCRQTNSRIHTICTTVYAMSDMNNIYQFQDISRIFTRVTARTERQTDRQIECINTFQHFWKVLMHSVCLSVRPSTL